VNVRKYKLMRTPLEVFLTVDELHGVYVYYHMNIFLYFIFINYIGRESKAYYLRNILIKVCNL
jgi:hypothetical protein